MDGILQPSVFFIYVICNPPFSLKLKEDYVIQVSAINRMKSKLIK